MGNIKGMLNPERFNILYRTFHDTKVAGIHNTIMPPLKSFASELLGLLSRSTFHDNKTPMNVKVKHSYMRDLPLRFHSTLQKWAIITKTKWSLLLITTLNTSISGARTFATESLEPFPTLLHPNFHASLFAILDMMINLPYAPCP